MAKGTASGEFVLVSQVRTGCKRELQFVLKSQSEICGGESLGRTRASKSSNADSKTTNAKKPRSRSALKPVIKKMRLTKDEEDVIMSASALEEDESAALADIEEVKGFTSESALVQTMSEDVRENGKGMETENVVMNEDHSREQPDKGSPNLEEAKKENSIVAREIVIACPAKLASRSCHVKLERGLGYDKPCRRLTRSMLKPEGNTNKSEANGDADHIIPERDPVYSEDNCVAASKFHEQNSADPCVGDPSGSSQMSVHKKEVNDTAADKPLRRFTRSLLKQESHSDNLNLENNTKPADLVKVDVHVNDVEMDDVQRPSVTTYPMRGRPKKFLRNFPAKLKEIFDSRILEGLTVYYIRAAKMREAGTRGLKGVIKGSGVLCFCCACKGTQVVSPTVYEQHASSTNKRPPEYILLESGFTLRDVMNACKETPLPKLEEKLLVVVGPALKKSSLCFNCQGPMVEPCDSNALVLCKPCLEIKEPKLHTSPSKANDALKGGLISLEEAKKENSIVAREIVIACPAKLASRSCHVKLERGLGYDKPCRRLTRSMLKPEGNTNKSEANGDADHIIPERDPVYSEDNCVAASKFHEQNSADPCVGDPSGSSQMSVHKKEVNDTAADKPLRRFTRSLLKQESHSDNLNLENNTKPADLVKVDVHVNDVEMDDVQRPSVTTYPMRGRPKKFLRNFPAKLKEIFDSRILEGLTVYYIRAAKMREAGTRGLKGVIKGSGVLCFCCACKGTQVVSPTVYEQHASSTNKRPPEYILLESGFTLRDVMNACKETPLPKLEEKLLVVVGPALKKSSLCFNCQGPMVEPCDSNALVLCKPCLEIKEPKLHTSPSKANDALKGSSKRGVVPSTILGRSISSPGRSSRREQPTRKSPEPGVVPGTIRSESKSSSIKSNQGKLTRKDLRLHKLVFEDDILPDGTEVGYFVAGKKMLVGYKKGFGIHCSCCNKVVSPSLFEAHAGCASRRKPFQHIYTTNGVSLHELSVALSMDQRFSIQENDDLCSICKDGGDLLCCDTCPRSYHIVCASLSSPPSERWSCKYCVNMVEREKFVDSNLNAIAAGRVHGVDAIDQITKRCIRIVSSLASELPSVCVLCRGHSFSRMGFNSRTVIICDQCEKEFHVGCLKEHNIADLKELPEEQWFCSLDCKKINTSLGSLIVHGEEKLSSNLLLNFLKKQNPDEESCPVDNTTPDIRWRVLSGKLASSEDTKILLTKAVSILHERFDPISESGTRGDLIPAMVYGRQAKGQDFSGMYCTMLTVDEVIVSVGIFRIFGPELAELPLVATSKDCQGQGYFQCLFACIQRLLGFLNVKHLVLPAADEAKSIWTDKFGFTKMTQEEVNDYRKDFSVMIFHGTSMLRKTVPAPRGASKQEDSMEQ